MTYSGKWHGKRTYFGMHYDLHARDTDTELGKRADPKRLVPMLRRMKPDWVQTDCKGHPGYTSWFSRTPDASIPPALKKDAMKQWRAATRELGVPLHCHYSGIWDKAAGAKHPEWCVVNAEGERAGAPFGQNAGAPTGEKMCPRSDYVDRLMIPQLLELIDRYGVDGFWIDGDLWGVEPCYCDRCVGAWKAETDGTEPPSKEDDPRWPDWWDFTRRSFEAYATRYTEAVHAHKPGVLVCSNWLQTFRHPGEPAVPTDWISGDNSWVWGLDGSRCEARFLSTRGKPWDIMLWSFYCSHGMGRKDSPWTFKPPQMLMQEAACLLAFGGNVQIYENPGGLRDGRLVPWRMDRLGEVGRFVKQRRTVCQDTETIPQIAVLHSEHHLRRTVRGKNLMWSIDVAPVQGAVYALLECHYGVDILDEWALLPRLREFPCVVVPEQHAMSDEMIAALREYVSNGGKLLVTGALTHDCFGARFLGASKGTLQDEATYHIPAGDGSTPLHSNPWRLTKATRDATAIGELGTTPLLDDKLVKHPAAVLNNVGRGRVAYIPANVCRDFALNRYALTRTFVCDVMRQLVGRLDIEVDAPTAIDVTLRRSGGKRIIHLLNRGSGIPNTPSNGAIDEIPAVGPVTIKMRGPAPAKATLAFEDTPIETKSTARQTTITVPHVTIHAAVVLE